MGSSPVTATIPLLPPLGSPRRPGRPSSATTAPLGPGEGVVVAFSGGPDSTALLWGMSRLAAERGFRLAAAHLDHAMDPGSAGRAAAAARLAAALGVPLIAGRGAACPRSAAGGERRGGRPAGALRVPGGGPAGVSGPAGSPPPTTATTRPRPCCSGSSSAAAWRGSPASARVHGAVVRPLLALPRAGLPEAVGGGGARGGRRSHQPRSGRAAQPGAPPPAPRARGDDPELPVRLARLAGPGRPRPGRSRPPGAAGSPRIPVEGGVAVAGAPRRPPGGASTPRLSPGSTGQAGAPYPAGEAARAELLRQLARGPARGLRLRRRLALGGGREAC